MRNEFGAPAGPVLVHSDVVRARVLIGDVRGRQPVLNAHFDQLLGLAAGRDLWFPTFNYGFLRGQDYVVGRDPSEVGALSEHARVARTEWRTMMPVFNFAGTGSSPETQGVRGDLIRPFDELSAFARLVDLDGSVLWYGAPISTATILHHAESKAGEPLYRYDKDFAGRILNSRSVAEVVFRYHVRPQNRTLTYDWPRIISEARSRGVIRELDGGASLFWAPARELVGSWVSDLQTDPLALLDAASRAWVEPVLDRLGRRFLRADFE